ncbi:MAG: hypoxanthine phosphoribosyltransferase [Caldilineales bacterium]|nr:hypoxanthine phosphoribosyltransferase [Caldilineales bacterium]MDW8319004.1 hypoxanthine phosphoribosyltransferase [Anaerolineae bacterium]
MSIPLHPDIERVLIDEATLRARVAELAAQIDRDYAGVDRLLLIGVLKGAFIFLADLARQLHVPHAVDFMAVSSYGMAAVSGAVRIVLDLREPIEGKHVMLVEDIVDSGKTLAYLHHVLASRGPASLRTCTLLRKERPEALSVPIDYLGFTIPDVWVVGYGLDYADTHRTLPYIGVLKRSVYQRA